MAFPKLWFRSPASHIENDMSTVAIILFVVVAALGGVFGFAVGWARAELTRRLWSGLKRGDLY